MLPRVLSRYPRIAALVSVAIGVLALLGWLVQIPALTSVAPGAATMKPNTALCIALLGLALWLIARAAPAEPGTHESSPSSAEFFPSALPGMIAAAVAAVAGATLLQYAFGIDLHIDGMLGMEPADGSRHAARMAPITAIALLLLALAFLIRSWGTPRRIRPAEWCALTAGFAAFIAVLGYAYGVDSLYSVQVFTSIAIHTALSLVLLASGFLFSNPLYAIASGFRARHAGGFLVRRLLPAAIFLPPTLGLVRLWGQRLGWYSTEFGVALLATSSVVVFTSLIWLTGRKLDDMETQRLSIQHRMRSQVARLALLSRITRAIAHRQDMQSIYGVAVRSVAADLPVDLCAICTGDPESGVLHVACLADGGRSIPAIESGRSVEADTALLHGCKRGEIFYLSENSTLATGLKDAGLASVVVAPLQVDSTLFGLLLAARRAANAFDSDDREFLSQLSGHVALAAHQVRLNASLQGAYDEVKQMQGALMQQERLNALAEMSSGVAHDINNAISPVGLYAQMLLDKEANLSALGRQSLQVMVQAISNIAATIARMRDFSRPSAEPSTLGSIDLNQIVAEVIELTRPAWKDKAQGRGVDIALELDLTQARLSIAGIAHEIRDAIANLILNAVDAMPHGGKLRIRTSRRCGVALLEIADTGTGMNEETRRRCLDPFYTTKGEKGTGLGLAMVYGTVKRHGAALDIESELGRGTLFRLRFAEEPSAAHQRPGSIPQPLSLEPLRILVIDDDAEVREVLCAVLTTDGHAAIGAADGAAGVDAFRQAAGVDPFDVVMTDLGMPAMDGKQVAAAIKRLSAGTPVIMLTGWGRRMAAENELPPGVDRILSKPPGIPELRAALNAVTRRQPLQKAG